MKDDRPTLAAAGIDKHLADRLNAEEKRQMPRHKSDLPPGLPATMLASEFATLCGVSASTVSHWLRNGLYHCTKEQREVGKQGREVHVITEEALRWVTWHVEGRESMDRTT